MAVLLAHIKLIYVDMLGSSHYLPPLIPPLHALRACLLLQLVGHISLTLVFQDPGHAPSVRRGSSVKLARRTAVHPVFPASIPFGDVQVALGALELLEFLLAVLLVLIKSHSAPHRTWGPNTEHTHNKEAPATCERQQCSINCSGLL
jgi:hypothetical protein